MGWSFFSLMSTNGSTATDLSVIATAAWGCASLRLFDQEWTPRATAAPTVITTAAPATSFALRPNRGIGLARSAGIAASAYPAASVSFVNSADMPIAGTSIHCDSERKYSSARFNGARSIRNAMMGLCLDAARSTSRPT